MAQEEAPILEFKDQAAFERWLDRHFEAQAGVWLKFAKKGTGVTSVNYAEALEVALCFGWIDGQAKRLDEVYYLQKFTPRRKRSMWSKINTEKVERLIAEGRMRPSGQNEIDLAKADGRWAAAYAGSATSEVPAEIENDPDAARALAAMNKANRFAYIHRFRNAKRLETREKLLQQLREGHLFHK